MSPDAAWLLVFLGCCYVSWYFYDHATKDDHDNPFDDRWGW